MEKKKILITTDRAGGTIRIDYGGSNMGNWEISIYKTFEDD